MIRPKAGRESVTTDHSVYYVKVLLYDFLCATSMNENGGENMYYFGSEFR